MSDTSSFAHLILYTTVTLKGGNTIKMLCSFFFSYDSIPGVPPPTFLQESLSQWINTDHQPTQCGQTMLTVSPCANHFLGTCLVQDSITGQFV